MKKAHKIILTVTVLIACVAFQPKPRTFCDGWEDGYRTGWTYDRLLHSHHDWAPPCPDPMHWEYTYRHGLLRGFLQALNDLK